MSLTPSPVITLAGAKQGNMNEQTNGNKQKKIIYILKEKKVTHSSVRPEMGKTTPCINKSMYPKFC